MDINDVIAALTARLGTPERTAEFKGCPAASWGVTRYPGPGIDSYVHADGTTHVDVWKLVGGTTVRLYVIDECPVVGRGAFIPSSRAQLRTIAEVDAYDGCVWPVVVPLAVAVDLAARVMART